ncbi:MAG: RimK family alpha-L-glutamate ligase, partial [Candidatus Thorarchaeota archaeon]
LSKRKEGLTNKIAKYLEKCGHSVGIFLEADLIIDNNLLNYDFYILKSKQLIYLYAAYFLEANGVKVIPDTESSHLYKNRIESYFSLQKYGFLTPKVFIGTFKSIKTQLVGSEYPLVQKPIMSSGSLDVHIINSLNDLYPISSEIIYVEKYIDGKHYLVYFIDEEICICEKKPLANEHEIVIDIPDDSEIKELTLEWKRKSNLLFGHLDLIREYNSKRLYIVDVGTFPEFSNWHGNANPVKSISDLILKNYYINR